MSKLLAHTFQACLRLNAALTRHRYGRFVEGWVLTPVFVQLTRWIRGPRLIPVTPAALGHEWERLLGDRRYARVTRVEPETATVYGEITGLCPLRGTGDVHACHRLMAYDRKLLAPYGGRLVVLASQAEPGRHTCEIAIRPLDRPAPDLIPAHAVAPSREAQR